jgi:A/G-specific adenine glycosylase
MLAPETFAADLLAWFANTAADLPWRRTKTPYHVWLSEIMAQQTQMRTVVPYFERFIVAFPSLEALAEAPLEAVLKQWDGLGYYSRARNLHRAAKEIAEAGQFPRSAAAWQKIPGVGRYTAGAIASIVYGERAPVLDGNVMRVFSRLDNITMDIVKPATQKHLWALAEERVATVNNPGDYNQALMELGARICKPGKPLCGHCPVVAHCEAFAKETQNQRPVKSSKAPIPHYDYGAAVIRRPEDGAYLICRRPLEGLLGGLWEFPTGRAEPNQSPVAALKQALRDSLEMEIQTGPLIVTVQHTFTHFKMTLHAYEGQVISGMPKLHGYMAVAWATMDQLERYAFARATHKIIAHLHSGQQRLF